MSSSISLLRTTLELSFFFLVVVFEGVFFLLLLVVRGRLEGLLLDSLVEEDSSFVRAVQVEVVEDLFFRLVVGDCCCDDAVEVERKGGLTPLLGGGELEITLRWLDFSPLGELCCLTVDRLCDDLLIVRLGDFGTSKLTFAFFVLDEKISMEAPFLEVT
jgi:hypothetical protein